MNVVVAECDNDPLVAVSVTWTVDAAGKLHDRVALPDPVKLVGLRLQFVLLVTRLTTPAKP